MPKKDPPNNNINTPEVSLVDLTIFIKKSIRQIIVFVYPKYSPTAKIGDIK